MPGSTDWNALVPVANRLRSKNYNDRAPLDKTPTHIVVHVTGTATADKAIAVYTQPNGGASPHYMVGRDGALYQFVMDAERAWHSGLNSAQAKLFAQGKDVWQCYIGYHVWYTKYPADAVYVDAALNVVAKPHAVFVRQASGAPWPHYDYFNTRWPGSDVPVNFDIDQNPNNYSLGIETVGYGSATPDPKVYTDEMYTALRTLVDDLCAKYGIPREKGRVIGHEDVNPLTRFGWDPHQGFDWSRLYP